MRFRTLLFVSLTTLALANAACAQPAPGAAPAARPPTFARAPVPAPTADPKLPRVREALAAAERGEFDGGGYGDLAGHPLYGWIEYAALRRRIDLLPRARAEDFLRRHGTQAAGRAFRELWLAAAARREDWDAFLAAWHDHVDAPALRCAQLRARQALGRDDAQWVADARALWLQGGKPLPEPCDAVFSVLASKGALDDALRWRRIDAAIAET
ncbi:MAG TPA: hypothetical protein VEY50_02525, partial [Lysobacter sp.]|nr:hypothetical protein [Lysobacter sp.]